MDVDLDRLPAEEEEMMEYEDDAGEPSADIPIDNDGTIEEVLRDDEVMATDPPAVDPNTGDAIPLLAPLLPDEMQPEPTPALPASGPAEESPFFTSSVPGTTSQHPDEGIASGEGPKVRGDMGHGGAGESLDDTSRSAGADRDTISGSQSEGIVGAAEARKEGNPLSSAPGPASVLSSSHPAENLTLSHPSQATPAGLEARPGPETATTSSAAAPSSANAPEAAAATEHQSNQTAEGGAAGEEGDYQEEEEYYEDEEEASGARATSESVVDGKDAEQDLAGSSGQRADPEQDQTLDTEDEAPTETFDEMLTAQSLPCILLHLPHSPPVSLFFSLEGEEGLPDGISAATPVWFAEQHAEMAMMPMGKVMEAIKAQVGKAERDKEMVLEERGLGLKMGEHDINLGKLTLLEFLQVHHSCELPTPVQLFLSFQPSRFWHRFEAIRQELVAQAEQRATVAVEQAEVVEGETTDIPGQHENEGEQEGGDGVPGVEGDDGEEEAGDGYASDAEGAESAGEVDMPGSEVGSGANESRAGRTGKRGARGLDQDVRARYGGSDFDDSNLNTKRVGEQGNTVHPHAEWARGLPTEPLAFGVGRTAAPNPPAAASQAARNGDLNHDVADPSSQTMKGRSRAPDEVSNDTTERSSTDSRLSNMHVDPSNPPLDELALKQAYKDDSKAAAAPEAAGVGGASGGAADVPRDEVAMKYADLEDAAAKEDVSGAVSGGDVADEGVEGEEEYEEEIDADGASEEEGDEEGVGETYDDNEEQDGTVPELVTGTSSLAESSLPKTALAGTEGNQPLGDVELAVAGGTVPSSTTSVVDPPSVLTTPGSTPLGSEVPLSTPGVIPSGLRNEITGDLSEPVVDELDEKEQRDNLDAADFVAEEGDEEEVYEDDEDEEEGEGGEELGVDSDAIVDRADADAEGQPEGKKDHVKQALSMAVANHDISEEAAREAVGDEEWEDKYAGDVNENEGVVLAHDDIPSGLEIVSEREASDIANPYKTTADASGDGSTTVDGEDGEEVYYEDDDDEFVDETYASGDEGEDEGQDVKSAVSAKRVGEDLSSEVGKRPRSALNDTA